MINFIVAPDQLAETDVQSSLCAFKENQSNVPTLTTAMVSTQRHAHAENSHLTMKPSSSDVAPKRFTLQNSIVEEFVQDSKSSVVKDIGSTVPSEPRSEASGLPSLSNLKNEGRLSASSEGSDDIDALSFKKSLLNFGNKTGLMNFVTPQNKQSEQSVVTKADGKYFICTFSCILKYGNLFQSR